MQPFQPFSNKARWPFWQTSEVYPEQGLNDYIGYGAWFEVTKTDSICNEKMGIFMKDN